MIVIYERPRRSSFNGEGPVRILNYEHPGSRMVQTKLEAIIMSILGREAKLGAVIMNILTPNDENYALVDFCYGC